MSPLATKLNLFRFLMRPSGECCRQDMLAA